MHSKQVVILKKLEKKNGLKFSQLGRGFDYDDKFPYHLKQLLSLGHIVKKDSLYFITKSGLENSLQYSTATLEEQKFKTVLLNLVCKVGERYIIKNKVFNDIPYYFWPRVKFLKSEKPEAACMRLFDEITGLVNHNYRFVATHLRRQFTSKGDLLFDNIFLVFECEVPESDITLPKLPDNCLLLSQDEVMEKPYRWPEIDVVFNEQSENHFNEYEFVCDYGLEN
jgi:hypothetical protein